MSGLRHLLSAASAVLLLAALGCGSTEPAPQILNFTSDRSTASPGQTVTLTWQVANADKLTIDNQVGDVTGKTTTTVTPTAAVVYTLSATNKDHATPVTATVAIQFTRPAAARIELFTASPSQVAAGQSSTLSWTVVGASTISIDGAAVTGSSLQVTPGATHTYSLTATGPAGTTAPAPATALVRVADAPTVSSFTATPSTIAAGATSTLSWSANALSYSLDNGIGYVGAATSFTVRPAATTTYHLTANGAAGTSTDAPGVTVTVTPPSGSRALSYAAPTSIPSGALLELVKDASSTSTKLVLKLVTTQAVQASAVAFSMALDGSRVALDAAQSGDTSPGFVVQSAAINPGSAPPAAMASLRTDGPLANVLTLGVSRKPAGGGAVAGDAQLAQGAELCRFRLVPAANAAPGPVFPIALDPQHPDPSDPYRPYAALLRTGEGQSAGQRTPVALGVLTLQ